MANTGENLNASQFLITSREDCDALDEKHTVFGQVSEGLDVLEAINESYCDAAGRPFQNIRIKHTIVLDDPFDDPPGLAMLIPDASPEFVKDPNDTRLEAGAYTRSLFGST
jgi:peptidyl-prolyl cis-trans isomerase-like 4